MSPSTSPEAAEPGRREPAAAASAASGPAADDGAPTGGELAAANTAPVGDEPVASEATPAGPPRRVVDVADPSRVRRAPRYGRFAVAGFLLAAVLSFALTFLPVAGTDLSRGNLFLLLLLGLGTLGIALGILLALWSDRRSMRRQR